MLITSVLLGLLVGLVLGGRIERLAELRLRYLPLLFLAVIVRFGTEFAITSGVGLADSLRLPLFTGAYALLLAGLWANRAYPGFALAFVGIMGNTVPIILNGGRMPVYLPSVEAAGLTTDAVVTAFHATFATLSPEFLLRAGPLGDIIPIPIPIDALRNVASIGDLFLSGGLAFFLFATVLRTPEEAQTAMDEERTGVGRGAVLPGTGLAPGMPDPMTLERPVVFGAHGTRMASGALTPAAAGAGAGAGGVAIPIPRPRPALERARRHPYVRLALNGSFSALWTGQLISLFGDAVNRIALGFFVLARTESIVATGFVFLAGALPNLFFSPFAGAYVDRWDKKQVLIVSDILRAALTMLLPVAVLVNVWLVYPLVFGITTVSIFFRPARIAILPRIVRQDDLLSANSALWVGETLADVVNVPMAGLFVVLLAGSIPLAFWFDAATYVASALLLSTIVLPPILDRVATRRMGLETAGDEAALEDSEAAGAARRSILADTREGWEFLRHEPILLANTLQSAVGQLALGTVTALMIPFAERVLVGGLAPEAEYGLLEASIGVGNLVGGFILGLLTVRVAKGRVITTAYALFGLCVFGMGFATALPLALGLMFGAGVANMAFVIPSQTLFQERTPAEMMGRVVGLRFALVFGAMSVALGVASILGEFLGPAPVMAAAGILSLLAGITGMFVPAIRDA